MDEHGYHIIERYFYMVIGRCSRPGLEPFGIRTTFFIIVTGHHTILMFVVEDRHDPRDPEEGNSHVDIGVLVIT